MHVFHTAGVPPRSGSIILPTSGSTRNSNAALKNSVSANTISIRPGGGGKGVSPTGRVKEEGGRMKGAGVAGSSWGPSSFRGQFSSVILQGTHTEQAQGVTVPR